MSNPDLLRNLRVDDLVYCRIGGCYHVQAVSHYASCVAITRPSDSRTTYRYDGSVFGSDGPDPFDITRVVHPERSLVERLADIHLLASSTAIDGETLAELKFRVRRIANIASNPVPLPESPAGIIAKLRTNRDELEARVRDLETGRERL